MTMTSEQFDKYIAEMKVNIDSAVNRAVNGKLDKMSEVVNEYIKGDLEWKRQAAPVIELGTNVRGFSKIALYILGTVAMIGAALGAIKGFGFQIFK